MSMVSQVWFSNNAAAVASLVLPHSQSPNPRSNSTTFFHDFKAIRLSVSRKFPSFTTSRLNRNRHFSSFPILMASVDLDDKLISSPHQALSRENPEAIGLQGTAWQSSMANKEPPNYVGGLARGTVIYPVRFPPEARMLFPIFEVFGSVLLRLSSAVVVVISAPSETLEASSSGIVGANDLMIVGPGVLGRLVAEKWREEHPGCQIFGQTVTSDHHAELIEMGIKPSVKGTRVPHKFPYVIFCAPPSQTSDYAGDIREAASNWSGEGSFLFTSSSAPYDCNDNGSCDEDSPAVPIGRSPRTDVLLKAEKVVLEAGGCVVRLAGLYKADRGAHVYWLNKGTSDVRPDHILNLIHYEDAASLSVVILKKKLRSRIFLGCDNHPLSRQEVMDLVERSGKFSKKFQGFTGTSDPLGKKLNNSKTRAELGWEPKYPSFAQFLGVS